MNRLGGKIILWGIVLGMLVFTAIRTLHFLMQTFPPDQQYVAFLALAAFDIGVLAWLYFATNSAEGAAQRTVSYGMIFVCAAGVIITTVGDMVNVSAQNHLTNAPGWWFTAGRESTPIVGWMLGMACDTFPMSVDAAARSTSGPRSGNTRPAASALRR